MNCYEKAGNLYQMIESLIQVFVVRLAAHVSNG